MTLDPLTSLASISAEIEAGWKLFDGVYDSFGPRDWARKFGKKWTYAEQPYHLAYFDRMIATHLALGPNAPEGELMHLRSMGDLDTWNAREFAKRASTFSAADALTAMRDARAAVRAQVAQMTDADLDRRTWMPLIFGWTRRAVCSRRSSSTTSRSTGSCGCDSAGADRRRVRRQCTCGWTS